MHPRPMSSQVVVVGSVNADLMVRASRRPEFGEAMLGHDFHLQMGGKGFNVAVAVARAGAPCRLIARVGGDVFGDLARADLDAAAVDSSHVAVDDVLPTGVGHVVIGPDGEYSTIIALGANGALAPAAVDTIASDPAITHVVTQFEVPLAVAERVLTQHRAGPTTTVLNPSPWNAEGLHLLHLADVLVVNEFEASAALAASGEGQVDHSTMLERLGGDSQTVVLTLGGDGSVTRLPSGEMLRVPACDVTVLGTLGAGDAFLGEFVARLSRSEPIEEALRWATACAATVVSSPPDRSVNRERLTELAADTAVHRSMTADLVERPKTSE